MHSLPSPFLFPPIFKSRFELIDEHYSRICSIKEKSDFPCVLVGNKLDLENQRQVSFDEAKAYADSRKMPYLESSAKERINIDEIFTEIVRHIGILPSDINKIIS